MARMTPAEEIARAILTTFAGPYYCAKDDTQRGRVIAEAVKVLDPVIVKIEEAGRKKGS